MYKIEFLIKCKDPLQLTKLYISPGLVVHAAADGIAMGAASLTDSSEIEFIIFMAIMLHKAPAAFGLTSFLLHEVLAIPCIRHCLIHVVLRFTR